MDPLFGSETRARALEQLAIAPRPQTAYRIARAIEAEPIQEVRILKALHGITHHMPNGWVLADDSLRRFLLERFHRDEERRRAEKDELLARFGMRTSYESQRTRPR